jgi:hypothetical protein
VKSQWFVTPPAIKVMPSGLIRARVRKSTARGGFELLMYHVMYICNLDMNEGAWKYYMRGDSGLEIAACIKLYSNGRGEPLRWPRDILYQQKLTLTPPTSSGRSVAIFRLRTTGHGRGYHGCNQTTSSQRTLVFQRCGGNHKLFIKTYVLD